jgi:3-oxoacyl-(acyl-carrier-protein) synthase
VGSQPLPARDHPQDFGVAIGYNHSFFQPPVHEALANHDLKLLNPAYFLNLATNAVPSLVAMQIQAQGGVLSLSSGFTAGLEAVWHASQAIGDGRWSGALAGAVEEFQPTMLESYRDFMTRPMSGALRSDTGSPCVYSEGAALMWLAAARPPVGAEAAAFWLAGGAVHQSPGRPEIALRHALLEALDSARIAPERIGFVFSAMSGDAVMDRAEEDAMRAVFKQHLPPRCLIKSILGETMHAHGALAVLAATECLREQRLPGTPGLTPWGASLPGVSQAPQSICFALGLILAMDPGDKAAVLVLGGGLDADV